MLDLDAIHFRFMSVRDALDERMKAANGGLPSVAAKWAGKVKGRGVTATNAVVAKALGR